MDEKPPLSAGEVFDISATARQALVGRWILCSKLGLTHLPQAGLEIGPDDRYATLTRGAPQTATASPPISA